MITENVMLRSDLKKQLQHLSIDKDEYISLMLIKGAKYILQEDKRISELNLDENYLQFTMKIDESLKDRIKEFCSEREIKIKAFWNEAAYIVIQKNGDF